MPLYKSLMFWILLLVSSSSILSLKYDFFLSLKCLDGNYHPQRSIPGIPVINQTHANQTSHLISLILTFVLSSNQYVAEPPLLHNIQTSSSTHPASISMKTKSFSQVVKWSVQSLTTHTTQWRSLKFSGATPPIKLSQLHCT